MPRLVFPVVFYPFASTAWSDKTHLGISPIAEYSNRKIATGQPYACVKAN
jgi:hypothetical protein